MDDVVVKQLEIEIQDLEMALRLFPPGRIASVARHLQLQQRLAELKTIMARVDAGEPLLNSEYIPTEEHSTKSIEGKPRKEYNPESARAKLLDDYTKWAEKQERRVNPGNWLKEKKTWSRSSKLYFSSLGANDLDACGQKEMLDREISRERSLKDSHKPKN